MEVNNLKKIYEKPEIEITEFDVEEIILISSPDGGPGTDY